ncbi:hypothetical protein N7475_003808 [Penicillium sp. IBT 31633x]|nr:hypothetical protein N7475_003808 [Penicillium sp. IBT 31633x]
MYLYGFLVPLLPYVLEHRLGLDVSLTQRAHQAAPLVAGVLFDLGGYWVAWSSVLLVILFDVVLRCLMVERSQDHSKPVRTEQDGEDPERNSLLPSSARPDEGISSQGAAEKTGIHFYLTMCGNGRFIGGVISYFCYAVLTASFDTTLPLHVRDAFNWGSLPTGLLFAAFQGPAIFLAVPVGWLKDRVGTRSPTTIGFALLVPLIWLIGVPGDGRFPWASGKDLGSIIYSVAMLGIGIVICLLNGVGMMEATRKFLRPPGWIVLNHDFAEAVDEIQEGNPGIFGPNGGYSRAISVSSISWTLGMFVGPILSGYGTEQLGYYGMNCILGLYFVHPVSFLHALALIKHGSGNVWAMLRRRLLELEVLCTPTICQS